MEDQMYQKTTVDVSWGRMKTTKLISRWPTISFASTLETFFVIFWKKNISVIRLIFRYVFHVEKDKDTAYTDTNISFNFLLKNGSQSLFPPYLQCTRSVVPFFSKCFLFFKLGCYKSVNMVFQEGNYKWI